MKQISISSFNDVMNNKSKYLVQKTNGHTGVPDDSDGEQGEYNEKFIFYKHPEFPEGVFLRETTETDSYGYDEHVTKIEFVEGREKTITIFEPVN